MKRLRKENGERGSVTIEASISMICFTFMIISLLLFINVGRAQMAIQTAINKSAQEISQYMYLYKVSGLYDLDVSIQASGQDASEKMNQAMTSLDSVVAGYEVVVGDIANGGTNTSGGSASNVDGYVEQIKTIVSDTKSANANLKTQSGEIKKIINEVKDNPAAFLKSLAALGVSKIMDEAKSFLVGSILGAALTENYLEQDHVTADQRLRTMNVVDGIDGLDFSQSSIFSRTAGSAGKEKDINLVVTYKVRVFTLFSKDFAVQFAQSASVQAWLGGDAEISVLKQAVLAQESSSAAEESSPESEPSTDESQPESEPSSEESQPESSAEESTEASSPEETTEESSEESTEESTEEPGGVWNSEDGNDYIETRERQDALNRGMYTTDSAFADYYDPELNEFVWVLPLDMTQTRFNDGGTELGIIVGTLLPQMSGHLQGTRTLTDNDGNTDTVDVNENTRYCLKIIVPEGSKPEYIKSVQAQLMVQYGMNYSFEVIEGYGTK